MSCVIVSEVAPISLTFSIINLLITSALIGSKPVVGSSKKIISGLMEIALAKATLFLHSAR